jgi:hypothetical protein
LEAEREGRKMNKYISKAVFYSERKKIIYSMLAYSLLYILEAYGFLSEFSAHQPNRPYLPPNPVHFIPTFIQLFAVISLLQVFASYSEKSKKYNFMLTQPYSKDAILITKSAGFVLSYLVPTIAYGIIASIIVILNKAHYTDTFTGETYKTALVAIFLGALCIIALMSLLVMLLQFLQMCFGNSAAAFVLPPIMLMILFLAITLAAQFTSSKLGPIREWLKFATNPLLYYHVMSNGTFKYSSLSQLGAEYFSNLNGLVSITFILIALVLFYICILLNRRSKAENTSNIFLFSFSEAVFKIVFSLFITIASTLIIAAVLYYLAASVKGMNYSTYLINKYGLQGKQNIEHTIYLALNILWIPVFAFVYRFVGSMINRRRTA